MTDFVLVQSTPNNPPGVSLVSRALIAQSAIVLTLTLPGGTSDNLDLSDGTYIRVNTSTPQSSISGIIGGFMMRRLLFQNLSASFGLNFLHQNAGSLAQNRIISPTGATVNIGTNEFVEMIYDDIIGRWEIINIQT